MSTFEKWKVAQPVDRLGVGSVRVHDQTIAITKMYSCPSLSSTVLSSHVKGNLSI